MINHGSIFMQSLGLWSSENQEINFSKILNLFDGLPEK
jgi:hypothetical protein